MHNVFWWGIGLFVGIAVLIWLEWPATNLRLINCNVGQGDAFLITQGFNQVLIDAGKPGSGAMECLGNELPFWDRRLELVVATHPDQDHIGGLPEVFRAYEVVVFLAPDLSADSNIFAELHQAFLDEKAQLVVAMQGQSILMGKMRWSVLWPNKRYQNGLAWSHKSPDKAASIESNDASVVILLNYNAFDALFMGDAPIAIEQLLVADGNIPEVEYLKLGHHGSKTSTSPELLVAASPELVTLGVGANNRYGHPNPEVIQLLDAIKVPIIRTDREGTTIVVSDGLRWWRQ